MPVKPAPIRRYSCAVFLLYLCSAPSKTLQQPTDPPRTTAPRTTIPTSQLPEGLSDSAQRSSRRPTIPSRFLASRQPSMSAPASFPILHEFRPIFYHAFQNSPRRSTPHPATWSPGPDLVGHRSQSFAGTFFSSHAPPALALSFHNSGALLEGALDSDSFFRYP